MISYLYSFDRFAGGDRVFISNQDCGAVGDLLKDGETYFVNIGANSTFSEFVTSKFPLKNPEVVISGFFSNSMIELVNWMVFERFSTYLNVVPLRIPEPPEKYISHFKKNNLAKKTRSKKDLGLPEFIFDEESYSFKISSKKIIGQQLIVCPDNFSLFSLIDRSKYLLDEKASEKYTLINSSTTILSQRKLFFELKNSGSRILITTPASIFQDRGNLASITIIDSHKRYYKSQRDPRYWSSIILQKMSEIYGIEIKKHGYKYSPMMEVSF